jgi:hypothetical protein
MVLQFGLIGHFFSLQIFLIVTKLTQYDMNFQKHPNFKLLKYFLVQ